MSNTSFNAEFDSLGDRFELAIRNAPETRIEDFLPGDNSKRLLTALLEIELEVLLERGKVPSVDPPSTIMTAVGCSVCLPRASSSLLIVACSLSTVTITEIEDVGDFGLFVITLPTCSYQLLASLHARLRLDQNLFVCWTNLLECVL